MDEIEGVTPAAEKIPKSFAIKTSHYVIGGFALATAISWNTAIKEAIHEKFPIKSQAVTMNFVYSVIITIMLVLLIFFLPDTKSELPESTQKKIKDEQHKQEMMRIIRNQQEMIDELYSLSE